VKVEENPKACCSTAIRAVTTRAKHIDNYYGVAECGKALAAEEIAGTLSLLCSFAAGVSAITQYITGYYNRYRPHQYNGGLSPLAAEVKYKKTYNGLASFS